MMAEQGSLFDLDIWSGKTYHEPSVPTKERTSKPSSRKSLGSSSQQLPMFLCLKGGNGQSQEPCAMNWQDGVWLGKRMMRNTTECRSDADGFVSLPTSTASQLETFFLILNCGEKPTAPNPTKLSEILEERPNPRYNLSAKACLGILNRANRRGKELPRELRIALENQASRF